MPVVTVTDSAIYRAADALASGKLAAFPTETVYGLGADATNAVAVAAIFEMKGRPRFNPLIVHVADYDAAVAHAKFTRHAGNLASHFWPGPLTLVLPKRPRSTICDLVSAGLDTIALRVPANDIAHHLLRFARCPVAAPSANRAGHVSPTSAAHVAQDLGEGPEIILDGGDTELGLESTVIDLSGPQPLLLRPGAIPREEIEKIIKTTLGNAATPDRPASPGQLARHYAPRTKLRLEATSVEPGEALLAFGDTPFATQGPVVNLSPEGDLREAASRFFAALRELDACGCSAIAVAPVPDTGLGEAINDRLRRAAARTHE